MSTSLLSLILLSAQIQLSLPSPNQQSRSLSIYDEPPTVIFQQVTPDGQLGEIEISK